MEEGRGAGPYLLTYQHLNRLNTTQWVWTTKIDMATWPFLKFDMRHGALVTRQEGGNDSDMRHCHFLNLTGDIAIY